jgi:hypothetical protein
MMNSDFYDEGVNLNFSVSTDEMEKKDSDNMFEHFSDYITKIRKSDIKDTNFTRIIQSPERSRAFKFISPNIDDKHCFISCLILATKGLPGYYNGYIKTSGRTAAALNATAA